MRAWGRITNPDGSKTWAQVSADANGFNDAFYVTALAQCLKLNLGESPFFAKSGIPQHQTIMTQVFPDFYVAQIQRQYAQFFASLTITRVQGVLPPQYNINAVTHAGATINQNIPT